MTYTTTATLDHTHYDIRCNITIKFRRDIGADETEILDVHLNSMTWPATTGPDYVQERTHFSIHALAEVESVIQLDIELDDDFLDRLPSLATQHEDDGDGQREERGAA